MEQGEGKCSSYVSAPKDRKGEGRVNVHLM